MKTFYKTSQDQTFKSVKNYGHVSSKNVFITFYLDKYKSKQ